MVQKKQKCSSCKKEIKANKNYSELIKEINKKEKEIIKKTTQLRFTKDKKLKETFKKELEVLEKENDKLLPKKAEIQTYDEFTNELAKYGGICGKCNKEQKEEAIKDSPSILKSIGTYSLSMLLALVLSWSFYQLNPDFISTNKDLEYFGDREFVDNEFASDDELKLYLEVISSETKEFKEEGLKELMNINPHKPLYKSMLSSSSKDEIQSNSSINQKKVMPIEDLEEIYNYLDSLVVENIKRKGIKNKISNAYPLLSHYSEAYDLIQKQSIYLYYEGLGSGGLWDKPGALNFGGIKLRDISFTNGPVPAYVIAKKSLEGNRNYFYVVLEDGTQGWMGRPYIMKDKAGREFLMPNPLTGEQIRTELKVDYDFIINDVRSNTARYIPSYDSINWNSRIPERFRREGYNMYEQAMMDGYDEVDRLISQYQGGF